MVSQTGRILSLLNIMFGAQSHRAFDGKDTWSTMSILEIYFAEASARSDWDRIRALIGPTCAGLPRLIREYNQQSSTGTARRLDDPDHTLAIPHFPP